MTRFVFKAYDGQGRRLAGELECASRAEALQTLSRQGRIPFWVEGDEESEPSVLARPAPTSGRMLSDADLLTLARELATLSKARLPVDEMLRLVALQPGLSRTGKLVVSGVLEGVLGGASLGSALGATHAVPEPFWRLVKAGEAGGTVAKVLEELALSIEEETRIRAQILSAMIYPAFLLAACAATLLVMTFVMLPAMAPLFLEAGSDLPVFIAVLAWTERFLTSYGLIVLAAIVAAGFAARLMLRRPKVREAVDRAKTRVPVLSVLVIEHNTARLARTLSMLIKNGVTTLDAMLIASRVMRNAAYQASIVAAVAHVNSGGSLVDALRSSELFPQLALRLMAVGERTGELAPMLGRVADIYEHCLRQRIQRLLALLAPVATLTIGSMVGLLVVSVMNAVLSLNRLALP